MFYVELTDVMSGCQYTDSVFIEVGQSFVLDMPNDTVLCDIEGIQLYAIPSEQGTYNYLWTPSGVSLSSQFSPNPTATPQSTTTYNVEVTSTEGCGSDGSVTITVNQLLSLDVTTDNNDFCQGEVANLTANVGGAAGLEFAWTPAQYLDDPTSANPEASPVGPTWFEVVVTDPNSDCFLVDSIEIIAFSAFSIQSVNDTTLCAAPGFQLTTTTDSTDPLEWSWQPAANVDDPASSSPIITVDEAAQFIVVAEDLGGCQQTDTVNVSLVFEAFDLGPTVELCEGEVDTLDTGYDSSFQHQWSTLSTNSWIEVSVPGWYIVEVSGPDNCVREDSVEVIVHALPVFDLGADISSCEGYVENLSVPLNGMSYDWSTNQSTQAINVTESGTYSVVIEDQHDCVWSDSIAVLFHALPVLDLPDHIDLCEGENVVLDAENTGSAFLWSNDATTQTITVTSTGNYSVEVTNIHNCSSTDATEVEVHPFPVVWLGQDHAMCQNEFYVLDAANPGADYFWNTGDTTQTITVWSSGMYEVYVDNGFCISSDIVSVVVNPLPEDPLGMDTTLCFLEVPSYTLYAGNDQSGYYWSGPVIEGSTAQTIQVSAEGVYVLYVTTPFGCMDEFEIVIEELCPGELFVPNTFSPNNDGINDYFFAYGENIVEFEMEIWDRWGEKIFVSTDMDMPWVGDVRDGSHYANSEVYIWVITYKYILEDKITTSDAVEITGHVTLIR